MLQLHDVHQHFGAGTPVLAGIDLSFPVGCITAIVGATGCGKSTLLRLLSGLSFPSQGTVLIDGQPIDGPRPDISMMFQEPRLFPWLTVEGNVRFGVDHRPQPEQQALAREVLAEVGLADFAGVLPKTLSGGMAQRVAFARAVITHPRVLLLDEPFSALDALTREKMQDFVVRWWRHHQATVVLVTHDVEEAVFFAHEVVVLHGPPGRIKRRFSVALPDHLTSERRRDDPAFVACKARLRAELEATS